MAKPRSPLELALDPMGEKMEKSFKQRHKDPKIAAMAEEAKWLNRIFYDSQEWYNQQPKGKGERGPEFWLRMAIKKHSLPKLRGYTDANDN